MQNLEFFVPEPELSFLKVCPSVVRLPPRQGSRVEVSFCPPKALPGNTNLATDKLHDATDDGDQDKEGGDTHEAAAGGAAAAPAGGLGGKDSSKKGEDKTRAAAVVASSASNSKNATVPPSQAEAGRQPREDKEEAHDGTTIAAGDARGEGQDNNGLPLVPLYAGAMDEGGLMNSREEEGENEAREAQEAWSRHGRWRVPCFIKGAGGHRVGGNGPQGEGREGGRGREALLPPLALEVRVQSWRNCEKKGKGGDRRLRDPVNFCYGPFRTKLPFPPVVAKTNTT